MRRSVVLAFLVLMAGSAAARADDKTVIDGINKAATALDAAFERQDAETIRSLLTPDHLAVTAYYGGPVSVADQIALLPDLKFAQTVTGEVNVALLGDDIAWRTFTAKVDGSFKGKPLAPDVFVGELWVKRDGAWLQRFYQVTAK
jgi:hypothetical protein